MEMGRWSAVWSSHALGGSKDDFCWRTGARQLWRRKAGMYHREIIVSSFVWHVPFSLAVLGRAGCPAELPPSALAARGAEGIWQLLLFPLFLLSLSPFFAFPFLPFPSSFSYSTLRAHHHLG